MSDEKRWQDEETLRDKYVEKEMSTYDVADDLDCSQGTIRKYLNKFDIDTRGEKFNRSDNTPWRDEERLREMYINDEMTTTEIADELGCGDTTICRWLDRHDIETRSVSQNYASYGVYNGYEQWTATNTSVFVHQLLVIADGADPHTVFNDDYHVHHIDEQPLHNLNQNLEVKFASEHVSEHRLLTTCKPSRDELYRLYVEKQMSQSDVAEQIGCSRSVISNWLSEYGIETRDVGGKYRDEYPYKDRDTLYRMYIEDEKTVVEIADELGCCQKTVSDWLDRHDIETRPSAIELSRGDEE